MFPATASVQLTPFAVSAAVAERERYEMSKGVCDKDV